MSYKFFVEKYSRNVIHMSDYAFFVVMRVDHWICEVEKVGIVRQILPICTAL